MSSFLRLLSLWLVYSLVEGFNVSLTTATGVHSNGSVNSNSTWQSTNRLHGNTTSASNDTSLQALVTSSSSSIDPVATCDRQWASYQQSSLLAYKPISQQTFTKIVISTETVYQSTYTCSSTCGNVCYADATTTATDFSTITSTEFSTSTKWATYTGNQPNCTVPSASCTSLWSVFTSSTKVYNSWYNNGEWPPESEPPWPTTPGCKLSSCEQTDCFIEGSGKVQVYYWPEPTTVSRDMCTDFPTAKPTDPWNNGNYVNTGYVPVTTAGSVELDGRTFYMGNVYLSIPQVFATNNCGSTLGSVQSDIFLTLASSDIYTARNDRIYEGWVYPVNYADFNPPYPWSAYKGALSDCASGMNFNTGPWCAKSVVFENNFHPVVQMPISAQSLDPLWTGCKPMVALVDPPIALSTAVLNPTANHPPAALPTAAAPVSTRTPVPTATRLNPALNGEHPGGVGDQDQPGAATTVAGHASVAVPQITVGPTRIPLAADGEGLVIASGVTISRGGSGVVIDGTTIDYGQDFVTLKSPSGTSSYPVQGADRVSSVVAGSRTLAFDSRGHLVAAGTTLRQDDPAVTIAGGKEISIGAKGITIIDAEAGTIQYIRFSELTNNAVVEIGGKYYSMNSAGDLVLGPGTTLHLGDPAVTISGTVVSMGTAGVVLVDPKGTTMTLSNASGKDAMEAITPEAALETLASQKGKGSTSGGGLAHPTTSKKGAASRVSPEVMWKPLLFLMLGLLW